MKDAVVAALVIDALGEAAAHETGGKASLVSVSIDVLAPAAEGTAEVSVARRTKTLLFLHAELRSNGARIATANSVHKVSR